jgi:hopanoid biosynthesis associated radical SAM protein HpnH
MGVPLIQALRVGAYIAKQKLTGVKRYPLVLMLEPLYRCNLACKGCGKIQQPEEILNQYMPVERALAAVDECGTPMVSIAGGEPLIHPEIDKIVDGLVARKKFIYLCTNALLLERSLPKFKPSTYLTFNVHIDGTEEHHDHVVDRKGTYKKAISAIKAAKAAGFRVTSNSTIFDGVKPLEMQESFDALMEAGVDAVTVSPGYAYEKAPDQDHFLKREKTKELFRAALTRDWSKHPEKKRWNFNHSPLFLDFLKGDIDFQCTPWGNPNFGHFGWQRPCYLFSDGYTKTFKELMETTDWSKYGTGNNEKCSDCMVHCGYEPTAVIASTRGVKNVVRSIRSIFEANS